MSAPIVVAGASGLIGSALVRGLRADGVPVRTLVRRPAHTSDEIEWLRDDAPLDPALIADADAVVCLNGASIGRLPWTRSYRRTLVESRLAPTRTLATALRELGDDAPRFLSASAVGYYGHRPGEELTERSTQGGTFLAGLCARWEAEALAAGPRARVSLLRTAPLLHRDGVLKPMLLLAKLGLSGPLGSGTQIWPWISLEDEVGAIRHVIDRGRSDATLAGPVNLCGPSPATANEIGRALARGMHRPYLLPAPRWALRAGLGRDAADSLLLADARVRPEALERTGYVFAHRTADEAVTAALAG